MEVTLPHSSNLIRQYRGLQIVTPHASVDFAILFSLSIVLGIFVNIFQNQDRNIVRFVSSVLVLNISFPQTIG